jgi:hypothetical protein
MLSRLVLGVMLGVGLIALACSSGAEPGADTEPSRGEDLTRTSEADGVAVAARWLTEAAVQDQDADLSQYPLNAFVLFALELDTHSGDLNEIDLQNAATLRQGQAEESAEAWVSDSDDSHHRAGVLVFPRSPEDGAAELRLSIGDDAVVLAWERPPGT